MRIPRSVVLVAIGVLAGAALTAGTTVAIVGASGTSITAPTWYGCLSKAGALSKVGTVAPTCAISKQAISWNSYPSNANGAPLCTGIPHEGIDLSGCDLAGANLTGTDLTGADLANADLTRANLSVQDGSVPAANLTGANLTDANLTNAYGAQINLTGANLTDANLTDPAFQDVNFTNANLDGATVNGGLVFGTWSNTTCPDGTNSNNDGDTCANNLG